MTALWIFAESKKLSQWRHCFAVDGEYWVGALLAWGSWGGGGQWTARRLFFVVATTTIIFTTICYEGHSTIILGMTTIVSLCVVEPKKYRHRHWHQRQQQDQTICQIRWKKPFLTKNESFASLRRFFLEGNETIIFKENRKNPFEQLETFLPSFSSSLFRLLCLAPRTSLERLLGTIQQNLHQPFLKVLSCRSGGTKG